MISDKFSQIFWKHLCAYHESTTWYWNIPAAPWEVRSVCICYWVICQGYTSEDILWHCVVILLTFILPPFSQEREMTKRALSHIIFKIQRVSISLFWVIAVFPLGCVLIIWSWFLFFSLEWRVFSSESSWDLRWNTILCHDSWSVDLSVFLGLSLFPSPIPVEKMFYLKNCFPCLFPLNSKPVKDLKE